MHYRKGHTTMLRNKYDVMRAEKIEWIAKAIFDEFPKKISGLKFFLLDCGCIYYQRVHSDGRVDPRIAVYRDAGYGICEICRLQTVNWHQMISEIVVVYNLKLQVIFHDPA